MVTSSLSAIAAPIPVGRDEIRFALQGMFLPLSEFGRRGEDQFLRIAGELSRFLQRSRTISGDCSEVADSLLRREGDEVLASLATLLDRLDDHIAQLLAAGRSQEASLLLLTDHLQRLEAPLKSLAKVIKILHSLSVSTRVESTQGHAVAVLQNLADDLKGLALKINVKTDAIADRMKMMSLLARGAREKTQSTVERSLPQGVGNLLLCRRLVESIGRRRSAALAAAQLLKDDSATISAALAEVVTSLQFHDITRQQVDHVRSALEDFSQLLDATVDDEQLAANLAALAFLQSAQLRHTRHDLLTAVERIIRHLGSIAPSVDALAFKTRTLTTSTAAAGANFCSDVEPVLAAVTRIIAAADREEEEAAKAVAAVLAALKELSQLLQEVELVGTEMKMISFNAGIIAAHNLERGAGLGVIARTIQSLSREVLGRTQEFSSLYQEMELSTRDLKISSQAPLLADETDRPELQGAALAVMARMEAMDQGVALLMAKIDREASSLATEVVATADNITVHVEAGKMIDELLGGLAALVSRGAAATALPAATQTFGEQARNYTMQSERRVHAEVRVAAGRGVSPGCGAESAGRDLTGLGENVELF